ncbi:MAG: hypothetical protein ACTSVY_14100 [Candidatus Helarchaeota archaeon]
MLSEALNYLTNWSDVLIDEDEIRERKKKLLENKINNNLLNINSIENKALKLILNNVVEGILQSKLCKELKINSREIGG